MTAGADEFTLRLDAVFLHLGRQPEARGRQQQGIDGLQRIPSIQMRNYTSNPLLLEKGKRPLSVSRGVEPLEIQNCCCDHLLTNLRLQLLAHRENN